MAISSFIAQQLRKPTGFFGWLFMGGLLNRGNIAANELVLQNLNLSPTDKVLEVGFGGGYLLGKITKQVRDGYVAGVDLSPAMVSRARLRFHSYIQQGFCHLHIGQVESLPFENNFFTKACTVNTIYFWSNLSSGFKEIARVLIPGGTLVVGFSHAENLRKSGLDQHDFALYTPEQVKEALISNGFTCVELLPSFDETSGIFCFLAQRMKT
ncbi:methyltransferase domain-containing protein [Nostocales cyanobacterium LEGE 11386]|nr:methyltransferase domain-containing protein [Nostocales cyanobacterium LEGE 11386]